MTPAAHQLFTPSSSASRQPLRLRLPPRLLSLASAATPSFSPLVKPTHHGAACDHMTHRLLKYPGCRRQQVLITEDVARRALWYCATLGERHGCRGARGALTPSKWFIYSLSHTPDMVRVYFLPCYFMLEVINSQMIRHCCAQNFSRWLNWDLFCHFFLPSAL